MNIESWFGSELQILTEIRSNVDLEFVRENPRFLMPTFQFIIVRILTDFDNFWRVVTLFHIFSIFIWYHLSKTVFRFKKNIESFNFLNAFKIRHQIRYKPLHGYEWGHSGTIYTIFNVKPPVFDTNRCQGWFGLIWVDDDVVYTFMFYVVLILLLRY